MRYLVKDNEIFSSSDTVHILEWLAEQIPGGFFIYRAHEPFEVLYVNQAILRIYGCKTKEEFKKLTGNTFRGMVHPDDFDEIQESIDNQIADKTRNNLDYVEYRIIRKDGAIRRVDDYGHLAKFPGYGDVYYVFIEDITERKIMEEEKLRAEIELEEARIRSEIENEKKRNEIKSSFLFTVSHDLRTPMNAIKGFTDLASRHMNEPELLKEYLQKVNDANLHMIVLIDDLIEMSRIDYGKVEVKTEVCNLKKLLDEILNMFKYKADKKKISVEQSFELEDETVFIDIVCFRRIMSNLISNALKFTQDGGKVKITAKQKFLSGSGYVRYEFTVADNGQGMSEEFMQHMFEAFEREEKSNDNAYGGTGLGLTITKRLLDIMGGSISVTSKKNEGSSFKIEIPLKVAREEKSDDEDKERLTASATGKYRILLVEDIEINRVLAETVLLEFGFSVDSVADGCDAVDAIREHPENYYDLVLMDIQMPVMNGYEATRAIRALNREDVKTLPIIALSANTRDEDKKKSLDSGMNYHVAKPFDVLHLVSTINDHIENR